MNRIIVGIFFYFSFWTHIDFVFSANVCPINTQDPKAISDFLVREREIVNQKAIAVTPDKIINEYDIEYFNRFNSPGELKSYVEKMDPVALNEDIRKHIKLQMMKDPKYTSLLKDGKPIDTRAQTVLRDDHENMVAEMKERLSEKSNHFIDVKTTLFQNRRNAKEIALRDLDEASAIRNLDGAIKVAEKNGIPQEQSAAVIRAQIQLSRIKIKKGDKLARAGSIPDALEEYKLAFDNLQTKIPTLFKLKDSEKDLQLAYSTYTDLAIRRGDTKDLVKRLQELGINEPYNGKPGNFDNHLFDYISERFSSRLNEFNKSLPYMSKSEATTEMLELNSHFVARQALGKNADETALAAQMAQKNYEEALAKYRQRESLGGFK